jgi:hypothetical protein
MSAHPSPPPPCTTTRTHARTHTDLHHVHAPPPPPPPPPITTRHHQRHLQHHARVHGRTDGRTDAHARTHTHTCAHTTTTPLVTTPPHARTHTHIYIYRHVRAPHHHHHPSPPPTLVTHEFMLGRTDAHAHTCAHTTDHHHHSTTPSAPADQCQHPGQLLQWTCTIKTRKDMRSCATRCRSTKRRLGGTERRGQGFAGGHSQVGVLGTAPAPSVDPPPSFTVTPPSQCLSQPLSKNGKTAVLRVTAPSCSITEKGKNIRKTVHHYDENWNFYSKNFPDWKRPKEVVSL